MNAEALAQGAAGGAFAPWGAENLDVAAVGQRQPLEDLDGGGLPGAVGAEQSKAFTRADGEIETRDGHDVTEALRKRATADRYDWAFSLSFSGGASWAILSA